MLVESDFVSIRVGVPVDAADAVRKALGDAGAGVQGNYTHCSGTYKVEGRFIPVEGAHPAIGEIGTPQIVDEVAIQTICHKDVLEEVIKAVVEAHPYEEPPIDIQPRYEIQQKDA